MTEKQINIFDRKALKYNRNRAAIGDWGKYDFLIREAAERLVDRVFDIKRQFPLVLDIGAHAGTVSEIIKDQRGIKNIIQCDISYEMAFLAKNHGNSLVADDEFLPFNQHVFDLVLSNSSLHWVNDLPGVLLQIKQILKPDGLFLATMFGGQTLQELRDCMMRAEIELIGGISPRISPFADTNDIGGLMQRAGFALPVVDSEYITVSYDNMFKLLTDIRGMGEANIVNERIKNFSKKQIFMRAAELYQEDYSNDDGKIIATFQLFYLHGWSPHKSQQQPLPAGSATRNLADFLDIDKNNQ